MKAYLEEIIEGRHLTATDAADLMQALAADSGEPALSGAVLAALRTKGETADEVRGFATAMRSLAVRPDIPDDTPAIDIVGTGGDGSGSLNLSTGAALVTAACGMPVVKHGNRSISSRCGSADVLQALGVPIPQPQQAAAVLEQTGFTFLFAPYFHPAMKAIAPIRRALGIRTVFNVLGPLTNPAAPPFYLIGAFQASVAQLMADALSGLPIERAFVLHGAEGWDEATPVGPFELWDVKPGQVRRSIRDPADFDLPRCSPSDLAGGDAAYNANAIRDAFAGEPGPHRDALVLATGLALEVTGSADTLDRGIELASDAIDNGHATKLLSNLNDLSAMRSARV